MAESWYVVVERMTLDLDPMPPYVVGPYPSEAIAEREGQSDENLVYCLLTIDAKREGYIADDVWWTTEPPEGDRIIPPAEEIR